MCNMVTYPNYKDKLRPNIKKEFLHDIDGKQNK